MVVIPTGLRFVCGTCTLSIQGSVIVSSTSFPNNQDKQRCLVVLETICRKINFFASVQRQSKQLENADIWY